MQPGPMFGGVIEGFYGLPWTPRQRGRLFGWMREAGLNTYMYGPKDDPHHRVRWREPYAGALLDEVASLVAECRRHDLHFLYALGPGLDLRYADPSEVRVLEERFAQLAELGGRDFALLFDDIPSRLAPEDAARFGSFARAQSQVANSVLERMQAHVPGCRLLFCPTEYCGRMATPSVSSSPYLRELGENLAPAIEVFWTGPDIISEAISVESIRELAAVLRRPPVIWDNLQANDYDMRRLFLGPCDGRPAALRTEIRGVLTNPNCQFEANFVPIRTLGAWLRAGAAWDSRTAYEEAIEAWLPEFATDAAHPVTRRDIELLGDLLYLPLQHGVRAEAYLDDLATLLRLSPSEWGGTWERFDRVSREIVALYDNLTALQNRDLLHALYRYLWELKEEVFLVQAFLRWRREHSGTEGAFHAPEFRPGIFRGGFTAELQRILPMDAEGCFRPVPNGAAAASAYPRHSVTSAVSPE